MKQTWSYSAIVVVFMSLVFALPLLASEEGAQGDGRASLDVVRVADAITAADTQPYGPFAASGDDPLTRGSINVDHKRHVKVEAKGATASGAYDIYFCRLGSGPAGCVKLGSLTTDTYGNGVASVAFDSSLLALAGTFVLTRVDANQFVSGFKFPSEKDVPPDGAEIELKGKVSSVNEITKAFQLEGLPIDIVTGDTTLFSGLAGLTQALVGQVVEVRGVLKPDKTIFALRVQNEDDPSETSDIPSGGFKIEVTGKIGSLNKPSFQLEGLPIDIVTGDATLFSGLAGFDVLAVGQLVEVKGVSQPDNTVLALRVQSEEGSDSRLGRQIDAKAKHDAAKSHRGEREKERAGFDAEDGD